MRNDFLLTDDQLADLARQYVAGVESVAEVKATYLRVLVARSQQAAKGKRVAAKRTLHLVNEVHDQLYAVILTAITTPELAHDDALPQEERTRRSLERNRRSNFARTAKYSLDSFLTHGGRLKDLDAATVTKEELRRHAIAAEKGDSTAIGRHAHRTASRFTRQVLQLAELDRDAAAALVRELVSHLGGLVPQVSSRTRKEEPRVLAFQPH